MMLDTAEFDNKGAVLPFKAFLCCFWRPTKEERVHHRNPLLDSRLGISIATFSIDEMHCVHLGICKVFCGTVIWKMLELNLFGPPGLTTKKDKVRYGLRAIKLLLDEWYPKERDARGVQETQISRIGEITEGMIGDSESPTVSTKANETKWLFRFIVHLLDNNKDKFPPEEKTPQLLACGHALLSWMDLVDRIPRKVPERTCKKLNQLAALHCTLCVEA